MKNASGSGIAVSLRVLLNQLSIQMRQPGQICHAEREEKHPDFAFEDF